MAAGAVTAAAAGVQAAQSTEIRGVVTYEGGKAIPKGRLEIFTEDPATADAKRATSATHVESDGGAKQIPFSLELPPSLAASPTLEIVARLERVDGWLVARGSAPVEPSSPVQLLLYPAVY